MRLKLYRGKWAVVWRQNGETLRRSLRTADRELAERRFADIKVERPGDTIADTMALYLAEKKQVPSHESMKWSWEALRPTFGHLRPDQVTRQLCRQYVAARRKAGRSDGTVIRDLGVLKAGLNWAKPNSGAVFEMPPSPPPRDRHLSRQEYNKLVAACDLPHLKLFTILALTTAGRASAILDLTWEQIDFERGRIRLSIQEVPKQLTSPRTGQTPIYSPPRRKGRATVPMNEAARAALKEAYRARESNHVIEWAGKPLKSIKKGFARAAKRASLKDVSPHVLRHTAAVWMAEAGVPMPEIAQYLGHSDPRVTYRVYARYSPEYLKGAASALEIEAG